MRRILKNEAPDLVHVHSTLASFYGRIAASLCRIKTLYTVHGWHFAHEPSHLKRCLKIGAERLLKSITSYWVTVSEFDKRLGTEYSIFRNGCVKTIPNGVKSSQNEFIPADQRAKSVVFVGRASYQKNCEALVDVVAHMQSDSQLTMYTSGGDIDALMKRIEQKSLTEKINVILNEPNASEKVHQFPIMLMTSRYEGMPLSVLEAMREGLVIVSTDVCGMNEVIIDGESGYLLPEGSEKQMAQRVDQLIADPVQLNKMSLRSKALFDERFALHKMLNEIRHIYQGILL